MKVNGRKTTTILAAALVCGLGFTNAIAQETSTRNPAGAPLGGQPAEGASPSVKDFDYEVKYHRAFEAVLWNMPATAIYRMRAGAFEALGAKDNDIITYSAVTTPQAELLTANS